MNSRSVLICASIFILFMGCKNPSDSQGGESPTSEDHNTDLKIAEQIRTKHIVGTTFERHKSTNERGESVHGIYQSRLTADAKNLANGNRLLTETAINERTGQLTYKAQYTIDTNGFRVGIRPAHAKLNILLMGGSIVFGTGLNDQQTLAFYLATIFPDANVIDLARSGYAPSDFITQSDTWMKELAGVNRSLPTFVFPIHTPIGGEWIDCGYFCLIRQQPPFHWILAKPWFKISDSGVQLQGTLGDKYPAAETLAPYLRPFALLVDQLPFTNSHDELNDLVAHIYLQLKSSFISLFPHLQYTVVLFSYYRDQFNALPRYLKQQNLRTLDTQIHDFNVMTDREVYIWDDTHPTPQTNYALAKLIENFIRESAEHR